MNVRSIPCVSRKRMFVFVSCIWDWMHVFVSCVSREWMCVFSTCVFRECMCVPSALGQCLGREERQGKKNERKTQRVSLRHTLCISFLTISIPQGDSSHVELFLVGRRKRVWYLTWLQIFGSFPRLVWPWQKQNTNTFPSPTEIPNPPPLELLPLTSAQPTSETLRTARVSFAENTDLASRYFGPEIRVEMA